MSETTPIIDEILLTLSRDPSIVTKDDFHKLKNSILAKYKESEGPSHIAMIERYSELVEE